MILFSIPVHEKPDVIVNQVENFTFFNPGCQIVLHVSGSLHDEDFKRLRTSVQRVTNVHINPTRYWTGVNDGTVAKAHISNCSYMLKKGVDFKYFCLHASNDMFVRQGLTNYIVNYDSGYYLNHALYAVDSTWHQIINARKDKGLENIMRKYQLSRLLGCQVEGSFYSKAIMETVINYAGSFMQEIPFVYSYGTISPKSKLLKKIEQKVFLPLIKLERYAKEEIYFPTLSQNVIGKRAGFNYCYIDWANNLNVTKETIEQVRDGRERELFDKMGLEYDGLSKFFAVKRVDRKMDDPIRVYINNLR